MTAPVPMPRDVPSLLPALALSAATAIGLGWAGLRPQQGRPVALVLPHREPGGAPHGASLAAGWRLLRTSALGPVRMLVLAPVSDGPGPGAIGPDAQDPDGSVKAIRAALHPWLIIRADGLPGCAALFSRS